MTFYGDDQRAAPTLSEVTLPRAKAGPLFREVLRNIDLMLAEGLIHGDLSAYNVLYWEGQAILIDFPQGTLSQSNQSAAFILGRDVQRVCEYFARQGVACNPVEIMGDLTERYGLGG
jgi:RIO kinase 1